MEFFLEIDNENYEPGDILERILPTQGEQYSLNDIDKRLYIVRDQVEELEREHNNQFDVQLTKHILDKLDNLYRNLHNTQLDIMKLQCDIAFTKEQADTVNSTCNSSLISERRELLVREEELRRSLHQIKFDPLREYFSLFASHLENTIEASRKLCVHQATNYRQLFDWTHYHYIILLLRACGKSMIDIEKFEQLYQSKVEISGMVFKQNLNQMDFNNFVKFHETYSLETQLEIITSENKRQDLSDFFVDLNNMLDSVSAETTDYIVLESTYTKFKSLTLDCCRLLINLNMNYIEAHLTEGINIDRLNGTETDSNSALEDGTLPLYAFSPQEYITQIGQHLLTLRKQTEQFDIPDNQPLKFGLKYLQQAQDIFLDLESCESVTETVMRCIARHCIRSLLGRTSQSILSKLTKNGYRQMATDALYLDNVLEDLKLLDLNDSNVHKFKALLEQ